MEGLRRTCSRGEGVTRMRHIDGDGFGEQNTAKGGSACAVTEWRRAVAAKESL